MASNNPTSTSTSTSSAHHEGASNGGGGGGRGRGSRGSRGVGSHRSESSGGVGRSKPRASLACSNCRQRKVKCDAQAKGPNAVCSSCHSSGIPCVVSRQDDRRKIASREYISMLQERLQILEGKLQPQPNTNSTAAPATDPPGEQPNGQNLPTPTRSDAMVLDTNGHGSNSMGTADVDLELVQAAADNEDTNTYQMQRDTIIGQQFEGNGLTAQSLHQHNEAEGNSANLARLTPPIDEVANGLDVDENCGDVRFYGPSTRPYIQTIEPKSSPTNTDHERDMELKINMDSLTIQALLLGIFWKSQELSVVTVHEGIFMAHRAVGTRSNYYSKFLEDSLLACATRMSTSATVRKLGEEYVERAKLEISRELEHPSIASMQGFLLLSDYEATRGKGRLGYIYNGIACRLLFDLGLHEDCTMLVQQGRMTMHTAQFRHILFLGTFVHDTLWGLYLGRPRCISLEVLKKAQGLARHLEILDSLKDWVSLCIQMSEVNEILNRASPQSESSISQLLDLAKRMRIFYDRLPSAATTPNSEFSELAPSAYGLQMQCCGIQIILHRTLTRALSERAGEMQPGGERWPYLKELNEIMYENAVRIERLVVAYQLVWGIENIITVMLDNIFIATHTLVGRTLSLQQKNLPIERDVQRLRALGRVLYGVKDHYPVAARMRQTLESLIQKSSLNGFVQCTSSPSNFTTNYSPSDVLWGASALCFDNMIPLQPGYQRMEGQPDGQVDSWFGDPMVEAMPWYVAVPTP